MAKTLFDWCGSTNELIEKDPSKNIAKWESDGTSVLFMWVDRIIDSNGVSHKAGGGFK